MYVLVILYLLRLYAATASMFVLSRRPDICPVSTWTRPHGRRGGRVHYIHAAANWHQMTARNFNSLMGADNYSDTSNNNTKLVHWPLMGGLLHLV